MADRPPPARGRPVGPRAPIGRWAFGGVAVASFGGPLALAAFAAPGALGDAGAASGLASIASLVAFAAPLAIWVRWSRHVSGPGGLYGFVREAAGPRLALVQAAIWTFSYLLYVVYTTVQIVYDLLPAAIGDQGRVQTVLALAIPVAIALVMTAGRTAALATIGAIAAVQVALGAALGWVAVTHLGVPASGFTPAAHGTGSLTAAGARTSLLYVCGSLPLFLGGELADPARTIRRGLVGSFALTALLVGVAVAPLAAAPGLAGTAIPGVTVVAQYGGAGLARAVGVGVALSTAGVILCEYLALTRLAHAVSGCSTHRAAAVIGAVLVLAAPVSLIDPEGFYETLAGPSLIALWLSQLIVFACWPAFARRFRQRLLPASLLGAAAVALAGYGLWTSL